MEKPGMDMACVQSISEFYNNSVILITGGTGFLGKVLVEKLLRSFCVRRIYMLVRSKNDLNVDDRLKAFFQENVFDRLRATSPDSFEKVIAIKADFNAIDLDISDEHKSIIWNEIVLNVVASVKFNERLRDAVEINVLGTKKILDLVMEIKQLKAFVHISTLYSNCNREFIDEKVYGLEIGYDKVIEMTQMLDDNALEKIQHCLVGEMPNTYTMTKRCSESLVNHRANRLPAGIFRAPIVLSTYKEPMPGWTDNLYGPSGICAMTVRGFIHCIHGDANKGANLVPADYCVNAILVAAWDIQCRFDNRMHKELDIPVYNYIYPENNLTWGRYMHLARKGLHDPFNKALWYYSYGIISSPTLYNVASMLCHTIPGYIFDFVALLSGQKRIYTKAYEKIHKTIKMMSYFGRRGWKFQNANISQLALKLNADERKYLEFDMQTIDWNDYFFNYIPGLKKYFYKEDFNLKAKETYQRLHLLHKLLKTSFWALFYATSLRWVWNLLFQMLLTL